MARQHTPLFCSSNPDDMPNAAHEALAELERLGLISILVTQNVDYLHEMCVCAL